MTASRSIALGLLVLAVALGLRQLSVGALAPTALRARPALTGAAKRAGMRFAPDVPPADRELVVAAIASARPEARRLIDLVDGFVTVHVGPAGTGAVDAIGFTQGGPHGFDVVLDLDAARRDGGMRGIDRLVLHELGHAIDAELVAPALDEALDARIPKGYGCEETGTGACAPVRERFAETFAKWATGDIGLNVWLGYRVLPPDSLDGWGAQLVAGARRD